MTFPDTFTFRFVLRSCVHCGKLCQWGTKTTCEACVGKVVQEIKAEYAKKAKSRPAGSQEV